MENRIIGTVVSLLPQESGVSQAGRAWSRLRVILEQEDKYSKHPKFVCVEVWGDKINSFALRPNSYVALSVDIESQEFKERWYTTIKAYKCEHLSHAPISPQPQGATMQVNNPSPFGATNIPQHQGATMVQEDLPF